MYKLLLPALLLIVTLAQAQNKAAIKGRIIDSADKAPLEMATVAILDARDTASTLLSYTLTDKTGNFSLHNLPQGIPLKVFISYVSYQPYRKYVTLGKGQTADLGTIHLKAKQLQEVVIKGERMPIVVRKDTIEFDAEAFKTRPNAVVEDLLKKLPGVEVDNTGKLTVMGKDVTKVMIDGHEFFANDPRIATKNLDADLIAKVQVYDDREDDPNHLVPENQVKKIINLKFKKALKKSLFGKVYGGEGTRDHYQAGGLFNMFRDTLQVSLLGLTNNLNNTGFDFNDLYSMGGLSRGGDAITRGGLYNGFGGAGAVGKQTATSGGLNINTDYGKKLKINLSYLYKRTQTDFNTLTSRQQFLNDTTAVTQSESNRNNTSIGHAISGLVRWQPKEGTQLKYSPSLNISQNYANSSTSSLSFSNFINPINNELSSTDSKGNTVQFNQSLEFNYQFKKKGESLNLTHNLQVNPGSSTGYNNDDLTSYIAGFSSYSLRRRGDNDNRNTDASVSGMYRYPVTAKLTADVSAGTDYSNQLNKVSTFDYDPVTGQYDSFVLLQSSDLTRRKWMQNVTPGITYELGNNIRLMAHVNAQWQQANNSFGRNAPDIDRSYFNLLPNANLSIKNFYLGYNRSVQLPNIGDMIPYSVVFSPLYSVTGNPDLKPTLRDNYSIGYNKFDFQSGVMYNLNAGAGFEQHSIFRERTLAANLAETSTPINRNGRYNYYLNGYLNKRFKKKHDLQLSNTLNFGLNQGHNFYVLNYKEGYQNSYSANLSERFSLNWKDIIQLDPQYTVTETYTSYSGINYNTQNYIRHDVTAHFLVVWPQHMNLEGNYNYLYNPLVPEGFQKSSNLLSLSLARQFLKKDRAEIKLSCYDVFNQSISTSRSINENSITDSQSQVIKRYFLLTLQWKFNKATVSK